ncbi:hypothetical protein Tco_0191101 [Tanacetum coccineum]
MLQLREDGATSTRLAMTTAEIVSLIIDVNGLLRQQVVTHANESVEARKEADKVHPQINQMMAFLSTQPGLSDLPTVFSPPGGNDGNKDDDGDGA